MIMCKLVDTSNYEHEMLIVCMLSVGSSGLHVQPGEMEGAIKNRTSPCAYHAD